MVGTGPEHATTGRLTSTHAAAIAAPWVVAAVIAVIGLALSGRGAPTAAAAAGPVPAGLELAVAAEAHRLLLADRDTTGPTTWPVWLDVTDVGPDRDGGLVARVEALVLERRDGAWHGPVARAAVVPVRLAPRPAVTDVARPLPVPSIDRPDHP